MFSSCFTYRFISFSILAPARATQAMVRTCTLEQGTLATEIERFKKVVKSRVEHRYKQVVIRVERLENHATNSSQTHPPHESQQHSDGIRYLEQNAVDSESLKDVLVLVEQRMEQVEANLDMTLKGAASASKVDETVTTIQERFSNFATRGDIQLMNVQIEEMQNIFFTNGEKHHAHNREPFGMPFLCI